jgi:hypothetical protein
MDRDLKIQDIAFAALFGALGIVALVAAILGKTHQFAMAGICALAVAGFVIEIRREERRAKQRSAAEE